MLSCDSKLSEIAAPRRSERQQPLQQRRAAGRLLHGLHVAAAAVVDAGFGDLGVQDGVGRGDVLRPHA